MPDSPIEHAVLAAALAELYPHRTEPERAVDASSPVVSARLHTGGVMLSPKAEQGMGPEVNIILESRPLPRAWCRRLGLRPALTDWERVTSYEDHPVRRRVHAWHRRRATLRTAHEDGSTELALRFPVRLRDLTPATVFLACAAAGYDIEDVLLDAPPPGGWPAPDRPRLFARAVSPDGWRLPLDGPEGAGILATLVRAFTVAASTETAARTARVLSVSPGPHPFGVSGAELFTVDGNPASVAEAARSEAAAFRSALDSLTPAPNPDPAPPVADGDPSPASHE